MLDGVGEAVGVLGERAPPRGLQDNGLEVQGQVRDAGHVAVGVGQPAAEPMTVVLAWGLAGGDGVGVDGDRGWIVPGGHHLDDKL